MSFSYPIASTQWVCCTQKIYVYRYIYISQIEAYLNESLKLSMPYAAKVLSLIVQGIHSLDYNYHSFVCFLLRFLKAKLNLKFTELEDGSPSESTSCDGSDDNDDCVDRTMMMCYDDGS